MKQPELVEYGIFQYESEYCSHVGFDARMIFLYETTAMQELLKGNEYRLVSAYQGNIKTSEGYLVPCDENSILSIALPGLNSKYRPCNDTTVKGQWAVEILKHALKQGLVPLKFQFNEITDKDMQIKGNDIIAISSFSIQVKCDWTAGPKGRGGSGNLFVQIRECNPFKKF